MNVLIAPTKQDGLHLLSALKANLREWQVIGYGGALLALTPDILITIMPRYEDIESNAMREMISEWFDLDVHLMQQRAASVITL